MFFFSSRRRHTRYWRDWSSDVCSSDLSYRQHLGHAGGVWSVCFSPDGSLLAVGAGNGAVPFYQGLSAPVERRGEAHRDREERRVGEGGRSRWAPDPLKKKTPTQHTDPQ